MFVGRTQHGLYLCAAWNNPQVWSQGDLGGVCIFNHNLSISMHEWLPPPLPAQQGALPAGLAISTPPIVFGCASNQHIYREDKVSVLIFSPPEHNKFKQTGLGQAVTWNLIGDGEIEAHWPVARRIQVTCLFLWGLISG